jgi:RNA polymerase sigma factor (sigma-70 family)
MQATATITQPVADDLFRDYKLLASAMVKQLAHRFPGVERAELLNEALLGLSVAARRYSTERGTRFSTYARKIIRGHLLEHARRLFGRKGRGRPKACSLESLSGEVLGRRDAQMRSMLLRDLLTFGLLALRPRERRLLQLYFCEGRTLRDAGALLGLSESRASHLVIKSLPLVRQRLETIPGIEEEIGVRQWRRRSESRK